MRHWIIASGLAVTALVASGAPAYAQQDAWITMKTKISFMTAENISTSDLNVDTVNGVVTLHGKVESAAEKSNAERVASGIDGVKLVQNLLQVVASVGAAGPTEDTDDVGQARVDAAFKNNPDHRSRAASRSQSVNKGVVLLSGRAELYGSASSGLLKPRAVIAGVRRVATEVEVAESR